VTLPTDKAAEALGRGPELWASWPADKGFLLPEQH
jgi:hypothetical protein